MTFTAICSIQLKPLALFIAKDFHCLLSAATHHYAAR